MLPFRSQQNKPFNKMTKTSDNSNVFTLSLSLMCFFSRHFLRPLPLHVYELVQMHGTVFTHYPLTCVPVPSHALKLWLWTEIPAIYHPFTSVFSVGFVGSNSGGGDAAAANQNISECAPATLAGALCLSVCGGIHRLLTWREKERERKPGFYGVWL